MNEFETFRQNLFFSAAEFQISNDGKFDGNYWCMYACMVGKMESQRHDDETHNNGDSDDGEDDGDVKKRENNIYYRA